MNIIRGKRQHPEAERVDGDSGRTVSRRAVLGGIAAVPVLYGIASVTPAAAATADETRPRRAARRCDGY
jgi:hypothetical protein